MKKKEFKEKLFEVLALPVDDMNYDEQMHFVEKLLVDYQRENDNKRERFNHGKPWRDEELKIILQDAPTTQNCVKYAKIFGRGYGSIEQIYRWAATSMDDIKRKRPDDAFILQIKRVSKEVGWRA